MKEKKDEKLMHKMENSTKEKKKNQPLTEDEVDAIRMGSAYADGDSPRIDNNIFFEEKSNPLSSKGS